MVPIFLVPLHFLTPMINVCHSNLWLIFLVTGSAFQNLIFVFVQEFVGFVQLRIFKDQAATSQLNALTKTLTPVKSLVGKLCLISSIYILHNVCRVSECIRVLEEYDDRVGSIRLKVLKYMRVS